MDCRCSGDQSQPGPPLLEVWPTWKDAMSLPTTALCIWIFIYSIGGQWVWGGGGHLDSLGHLTPLFPNKHNRPSSVWQNLISVPLRRGRGDGDKVSYCVRLTSRALTIFFSQQATGYGSHVEITKEVSTHCKSHRALLKGGYGDR